MRPEIVAALDQADAAAGEAVALMDALAAASGDEFGRAVMTSRPMLKVRDKLVRHLLSPGYGCCEHLRGVEPVHWAAWAPGRLRCAPCTAAAAQRIRGTVEDRRCDACRRVGPGIHTATVQLPPTVVDLGPETAPITVPPMFVHFGLCRSCYNQAAAQ
jgi:hypothetical protein